MIPVGSGAGSRASLRRSCRRVVLAATLAVAFTLLVTFGGPSATTPSAAACSQTKTFITGTPDQSLLSILGVLRRRATPADALPLSVREAFARPIFRMFGREIFVNYIRRARVVAGTSYYVMPVLYTGCAAFGRGESMLLWAGGSGGGVGTAATIEQGSAYATLGSFGHTTIETLIPDGVATVMLHYPAGKIGGFDRSHAPAITITTNVVGNLLIVTVPRGGNRLMAPMTMTWRAADGATVKTFSRL
jgi:hypothetical protein